MGDVVVIDAGSLGLALSSLARQFGEFLISEPPILRNSWQDPSTLDPALEVATEKLPLTLHLPFYRCSSSIHHVVLATRPAFTAPSGCPTLSRCAPMSALLHHHNSFRYVFLPVSCSTNMSLTLLQTSTLLLQWIPTSSPRAPPLLHTLPPLSNRSPDPSHHTPHTVPRNQQRSATTPTANLNPTFPSPRHPPCQSLNARPTCLTSSRGHLPTNCPSTP
jgi:hypothetical protein